VSADTDGGARCSDCRFWRETGRLGNGERHGDCLRFPPVLVAGEVGMAATGWCGEHAPRVSPACRAALGKAMDRAERDIAARLDAADIAARLDAASNALGEIAMRAAEAMDGDDSMEPLSIYTIATQGLAEAAPITGRAHKLTPED
jgi:hypothetical protein